MFSHSHFLRSGMSRLIFNFGLCDIFFVVDVMAEMADGDKFFAKLFWWSGRVKVCLSWYSSRNSLHSKFYMESPDRALKAALQSLHPLRLSAYSILWWQLWFSLKVSTRNTFKASQDDTAEVTSLLIHHQKSFHVQWVQKTLKILYIDTTMGKFTRAQFKVEWNYSILQSCRWNFA